MSVPNKLVVIGGGSTAMDVVKAAVRLGASEVTVIYRRSEKEMPAGEEEIVEAREEGAKAITMVSPVEFLEASKKVTDIHLAHRKETDYSSDGRRCVAHIPDSGFFLKYDGAVTTTNQDVDHQAYRTTNVEVKKNGKLAIGRSTGATSEKGVFAGGGVSPWGANVVIQAIVDGKEAAVKTDQYLGGQGELNQGERFTIPEIDIEVNGSHSRLQTKCLSPEERKDNSMEVNCEFHKLDATGEALRCLYCDHRQTGCQLVVTRRR